MLTLYVVRHLINFYFTIFSALFWLNSKYFSIQFLNSIKGLGHTRVLHITEILNVLLVIMLIQSSCGIQLTVVYTVLNLLSTVYKQKFYNIVYWKQKM